MRNSDEIREIGEPDGAELDGCVKIRLTSIRNTALWHDIPCLARGTNQFICKVEAQEHTFGTVIRSL